MSGATLREILAAELETRWDVMYRELRRRKKVLERAKAKAVAGFEAAYTRYCQGCERVSDLRDIPAAILAQWEDDIDLLREIVVEIGQALGRTITQLRRHEEALPGLRDSDPRAVLAPEPHERHRIAANARQRRYLAKRKAKDQTLAAA